MTVERTRSSPGPLLNDVHGRSTLNRGSCKQSDSGTGVPGAPGSRNTQLALIGDTPLSPGTLSERYVLRSKSGIGRKYKNGVSVTTCVPCEKYRSCPCALSFATEQYGRQIVDFEVWWCLHVCLVPLPPLLLLVIYVLYALCVPHQGCYTCTDCVQPVTEIHQQQLNPPRNAIEQRGTNRERQSTEPVNK
ncbi:hypothetical protein CBL_14542 [Carabus blaptoides fortunei]